jgi:hypothetical protein
LESTSTPIPPTRGIGVGIGGTARRGIRRMIELCPAGRAGTPDEIGNSAIPPHH